jgi:anhydro-N-acetylmuramic acid kinase
MNELKGIGIMSGSSLDGLDISFCEYRLLDSKWDFTFLIGETIPFV